MTHIFIVFHSKIFHECYSTIPDETLKNNFTFVAVNPKIPKSYKADIHKNRYNVINEWELPIYNPDLQNLNQRENSVLYHVHANGLHLKYNKIGFFQYDMSFKNINILDLLNDTDKTICDVYYETDYDEAFITTWLIPNNDYKTLFFNDYENHFNKKINFNKKFPLYNSFIVDTAIYSKMMIFLSPIYTKYHAIFDYDTSAYMAGIYERYTALVLSQEDIHLRRIQGIDHNLEFKKSAY
jgi:hypothetical protein